jgi:hypothetical protein
MQQEILPHRKNGNDHMDILGPGMRTWISKNEPHEDYEIDLILATLYEEVMAIPRWKIWKWWPIMAKITKLEIEHKDCCGTDPT